MCGKIYQHWLWENFKGKLYNKSEMALSPVKHWLPFTATLCTFGACRPPEKEIDPTNYCELPFQICFYLNLLTLFECKLAFLVNSIFLVVFFWLVFLWLHFKYLVWATLPQSSPDCGVCNSDLATGCLVYPPPFIFLIFFHLSFRGQRIANMLQKILPWLFHS